MKGKTEKIAVSSLMIALSAAIALVCDVIPFLNLPFGGGFTIAASLPIIIASYMYGVRWGFGVAFIYSLVQLALGAFTGSGYVISLFTIGSDDYIGVAAGIVIIFIDYILAYTLLGLGGVFRHRMGKGTALVLGSILSLGLRYIAHIISGAIFFGTWAEWFFSQEGFYAIGGYILNNCSGTGLSLAYAAVYNGLYMLPETVITAVVAAVVARVPHIKKKDC